MLVIEKAEGGYIVTVESRKIIATSEHVANLIMRCMKDVVNHIERNLQQQRSSDVSQTDHTD